MTHDEHTAALLKEANRVAQGVRRRIEQLEPEFNRYVGVIRAIEAYDAEGWLPDPSRVAVPHPHHRFGAFATFVHTCLTTRLSLQ